MFNVSGEKLYLSSGMASATSTIFFSTQLISWFRAEAIVGADGCRDCWGGGALAAAAFFALCAGAATVKMSTAKGKKIRICFLRVTLLNWIEPKSRCGLGK